MKKIPLIINCDDDIDDAVAIMMAINSKIFDVKLITLESDENSKDFNDLTILDKINQRQISVIFGSNQNFSKKQDSKQCIEQNNESENIDSVHEIYKLLNSSETKMTILCIDSLKIIQTLLSQHQDIINKIEKLIIVLDTNIELKNNYQTSTFGNLELLKLLLSTNVKTTLIPSSINNTAHLDWEAIYKTKTLNNFGEKLEIIFRDYKTNFVQNGISILDACAVAHLINQKVFDEKETEIKIDDKIIDFNFDKKSNIKICSNINLKNFRKTYFCCLKKCK